LGCLKKNYAPTAGTGAVISDLGYRLNIRPYIWYDFFVLEAVRDELFKLLNKEGRSDKLFIKEDLTIYHKFNLISVTKIR
jgi:hypothetical protein